MVMEEINKKQKRAKDFTNEEAQYFFDRIRTIGIGKAAKEAGVSLTVAASLRKRILLQILKEPPKQKTITLGKTYVNEIDAPEKSKRSKDFTEAEKDHILQRVKEIGWSRAAHEAGTTRWVIKGWQCFKGESKTEERDIIHKIPEQKEPQIQTNPQPVDADWQKLREQFFKIQIENALLKERLAALLTQVNKLNTVIGQLI